MDLMLNYSPNIYAECKRQFIHEGKSFHAISKAMGGKPVAQTINNWSRTPDENGRDWFDLRKEYADAIFENASPSNIATRLLQEINKILDAPEIDTKKADAVAKFSKVLRDVTEPVFQMHVIYQTLSDLVAFAQDEYPETLKNKRFFELIRDFRTHCRGRLGV
jgi:hypothetical protein